MVTDSVGGAFPHPRLQRQISEEEVKYYVLWDYNKRSDHRRASGLAKIGSFNNSGRSGKTSSMFYLDLARYYLIAYGIPQEGFPHIVWLDTFS